MRNIIIIFFVFTVFFANKSYAQKPVDSLSKKNALAKEIQKKTPKQIREAYKKTHPQKPTFNSKKSIKSRNTKKSIQPSSVIKKK